MNRVVTRHQNKTETESMRCSPELSDALRVSAERHGMTISALMETLAQRHVNAQRGLQGLSPHDVLAMADRIHRRAHEAYEDGVLDLPENWEISDLLTETDMALLKHRREAA